MTKPVRPRESATADFDDAADFYTDSGGLLVAERFGMALTAAYDRLEANPGIGSPIAADILRRPGLRTWPVPKFPYLILYFERQDHVDVWRILHGARDLQSILDDEA